MNEAVREQLSKARTQLILNQPFFGALALRLRLIESEQVPTLAVDGKNVYYNPKFVATLSPRLTQSAMAHETLHCALQHIGRVGARDKFKWNCAIDFVTNEHLKESGFEISPSWLLNKDWYGKTAEEIYTLLNDKNCPKPGSGPGSADRKGQGPLCDATGSATGTNDPEEGRRLERDWRIATIQAASAAKQAGKLPANFERFLDELLKPQINWREQLRRFMTEIVKNDFDWTRPNKRLLPYKIVLPTLHSEEPGTIAAVIDTSGSIDDKTLQIFASELDSIHKTVKPSKLYVIYCDAAINKVDEFEPDDIIKLKMYGGGGTDFRPPFKYLKEHSIDPKCLVYLTDLMGPFGDEPEYPVMWACISDLKAPWGETLKLHME